MRIDRAVLLALVPALLAMGVCFRFAHLERRVYWYDEAFTSLWISGHSELDVTQALAGQRPVRAADLAPYRRLQPGSGIRRVVDVLTRTEPQLAPLYPLAALIWARNFGDSVAAVRGLSAVLGLLAFPLLLWVCLELYGDWRTGWMAVSLLAVSPVHVAYAQEACAYSLWVVFTLLSSGLLLTAIRTQSGAAWWAYAAIITLGLYTHLLFGLVVLAHGLYVALDSGFRCTGAARGYLAATLGGGLLLAPWILNLAARYEITTQKARWLTTQGDLLSSFKAAFLNFACIVFDSRMRNDDSLHHLTWPIVILMAYSLLQLTWARPRRVWCFVLPLVGVIPLALLIPDILWGGRRLSVTRYAFPAYLGVVIALADCLASRLADRVHVVRRALWAGIAATLLCAGALSSASFARAETWWHKSVNYDNHEVARRLLSSSRPLLLSDRAGLLLSLSYAVGPDVHLMLATPEERLDIPPGFSDVFVFTSSESFRSRLTADEGWTLRPVYAGGHLWRLAGRADAGRGPSPDPGLSPDVTPQHGS